MNSPKRSEIWLVDLNPTRGQELQKTRPAVVISSNLYATLQIRVAVPITSWQPKFQQRPFMVFIPATESNGLDRDSAANLLQIRSLSTERFVSCLGILAPEILQEIIAGVVVCIDYQP